jgi:uncharacterized membrane protein
MQLTRYQRLTLGFFAIAFFGVYTMQAVLNHYFMRTYALDYGFYNQAFWDFAHFRTNANTVFEPQLNNYFQVHPAFTLPLLSPLYWIFTPIFGTYSLLIIQNIFIILGGYGTFLFIHKKTGNFIIALLAFVHYNLLWGHFSAICSDYTDTTVAASMMPFFLYFFNEKKFIPAAMVFLFITICKENMPIWFIFITVMLIILYKDRVSRQWAVAFGFFSLVYLVFVFKVLIPYFQDPGMHYWGFAYSALGKNPVEAAGYLFTHPWQSMRLLFENNSGDPLYNGIKLEFYRVFLISGGCLLVLRPAWIILFIPIIAQKAYNDLYMRWGINLFYSIEVVSVLSLAVFMATDIIKKTWIKYAIYAVLCIVTFQVTHKKMEKRVSLWYDDRKENLFSPKFYHSPNNNPLIRQEIDRYVPLNANVCAMQDIVPHLAFRKNISMFPYVHQAEYLIFVMNGNTYPLNERNFADSSRFYVENPGWKTIVNDPPLIILQKK